MVKYYAGIGSRATPASLLAKMRFWGSELARHGYVLRSGGADGADSAFEQGCDEAQGQKEIYLPWKGFNKNTSQLYAVTPQAFELAELYHPAWDRCNPSVRRLHARNMHQMLGLDLKTPVDFVLCYHNGSGGTLQAIRVAINRKIPVLNLRDNDAEHKLVELLLYKEE